MTAVDNTVKCNVRLWLVISENCFFVLTDRHILPAERSRGHYWRCWRWWW